MNGKDGTVAISSQKCNSVQKYMYCLLLSVTNCTNDYTCTRSFSLLEMATKSQIRLRHFKQCSPRKKKKKEMLKAGVNFQLSTTAISEKNLPYLFLGTNQSNSSTEDVARRQPENEGKTGTNIITPIISYTAISLMFIRRE